MNIQKTGKNQEKTSENSMYYRKSADNYRIAKWLVIMVFILGMMITMIFGYRELSPLRFRYLSKYFRINPFTMNEIYHDISYSLGGGSSFAFYHDDLAVLGEGMAALYDLSGEMKFRTDIEKGSPSAKTDGEYLAVFTAGKNRLSLFHSFGKAWEASFEFPISSVAVSKKGMTAVCLKEPQGDRIVVLDRDFERQTQLLEEGIVMELCFSSDEKSLLVLTLCGSDGSYYTKLNIWNLHKNECSFTENYIGCKPLSLTLFSDGNFAVLLDRSAVFYTENGKKEETISFYTNLLRTDTEENRLLLLTADEWMLFDSYGKKQCAYAQAENISEIKISQYGIYLLAERSVLCYNELGEEIARQEIPSGALDLFPLKDGSVLLCYTSETKRITISD